MSISNIHRVFFPSLIKINSWKHCRIMLKRPLMNTENTARRTLKVLKIVVSWKVWNFGFVTDHPGWSKRLCIFIFRSKKPTDKVLKRPMCNFSEKKISTNKSSFHATSLFHLLIFALQASTIGFAFGFIGYFVKYFLKLTSSCTFLQTVHKMTLYLFVSSFYCFSLQFLVSMLIFSCFLFFWLKKTWIYAGTILVSWIGNMIGKFDSISLAEEKSFHYIKIQHARYPAYICWLQVSLKKPVVMTQTW